METRSAHQSHPGAQICPVRFTGRGWDYAKIWSLNLALTLASLGLFLPWARVRTRRYFLGQIQVQGIGFDYQADPRALLLGWAVIGLVFTLLGWFSDQLAAALTALLATERDRWLLVVFLSLGLALLVQGLPFSWVLVQSLRYNASRTSHRNIRFGFGSRRERWRLWREMVVVLLLRLLVPLSLGLLQPYVAWRWRRLLISHRRFGTTPFQFTATPAEYARLHLRALPLLLLAVSLWLPFLVLSFLVGQSFTSGEPVPSLTAPVLVLVLLLSLLLSLLLGLVWSCWLEAAAANLTWRSIRLGELRFESRWRARDLLALRLRLGLTMLVSLGLAWPWARIVSTRYRLERISISPAEALGGFLAGEEERLSALAEGGFTLDDALSGIIDISL
jgi:uncharacterized membrane protein YjgN (DUF898 family)